MSDEAVIKQILVEAGVYSWALAQAGSEAELVRMFCNDFKSLLAICRNEKALPGANWKGKR